MCFDLLLPSSMFASVYAFFDLVLFALVWFGLTVYKITCELVIRALQFVVNTRREFRTCEHVSYMVNYAHKSTTDIPIMCTIVRGAYILNGK